jgi:hypothetical protein
MADLEREGVELDRELGGAPDPKPDEPAAPAAPGEAPSSPAAPAPISLDQELAGMFEMVGAGVGQFFPSVKAVLDESRARELGSALAPVIQKYGLERYFAGFAWRVELHAALVVIPTIVAVREAIRHDLAELKRAAKASSGGQAEPPPAPPAGVEVLKPIGT